MLNLKAISGTQPISATVAGGAVGVLPDGDGSSRRDQRSLNRAYRASVDRTIGPRQPGRVHYQGTYWFGICRQGYTLLAGTDVVVVGRTGNTLIVEPVEPMTND